MQEKSKFPIYGEAAARTVFAWLLLWTVLCGVLSFFFPFLDPYPPPTPEEKRSGTIIVVVTFLYSLTVAYRYFRQQVRLLSEKPKP